jgi:hypothetical protein
LTNTVPDSWAPMLWAHGNSAWIAERQNPGGSAGQVWVYTTTNNGTSWNNPVSLSGRGASGSAETFPYTVASSDQVNVFVAWSHQIRSGYWTFMISYSGDGGIHWTAPPGINVSKNNNGEAGRETDIATGAISSYGATCYAAWQYTSGTSNQIYYATVSM